MRLTVLLFIITALVVPLSGVALAMEVSGVVTAVNVEKNALTIGSGTKAVSFDCEKGSLLKGIHVGDTVTVQYTQEVDRKLATNVTRMAPGKEEAPAPYNPPGY